MRPKYNRKDCVCVCESLFVGAWTPALEEARMGAPPAPVAQLDRVLASEARGRGFESRRARQFESSRNPHRRCTDGGVAAAASALLRPSSFEQDLEPMAVDRDRDHAERFEEISQQGSDAP